MRDPRHYVNEIQENVQKMRAQGQVTATENALFGMIDGLAGLVLRTLERVTALEQQLGVPAATARRRSPIRPATPGKSGRAADEAPEIAARRRGAGGVARR